MKYRVFLILALLLMSIVPLAAQEETKCEDDFRLIVHEMGATCVPNDVQRVVTLEHSMTESVVTLGVQPVGVADIELYNALVNLPIPLSEEASDVGSRREPNLEIITSLNPDLIIAASWRVGENYDELSAIAPTITFVGAESLATMRDYFTTIAVALNREAEAQRILEDMDQHFIDAATRVANATIDPGFVLSQTWYEDDIATFRLLTDNSMPVEILTRLGLENTWSGEPNPDGYSTVGIEAVGEIKDTNFLFLTDVDSAPFYDESPLWNSLPFVQAGTVYRLNDDLWLFGGPLSAQRFVDAVLAALGVDEVVLSGVGAKCEAGFRLFDHELLATDPVCIPENPQRVAFIDSSIAYGIALGVESITRNYYFDAFLGDFPTLVDAEAMNAMIDVGNTWEINAEALLESQPDLIVSATWWTETNAYAQAIAPTIIIDFDRAASWLEGFDLIAQLTGRIDEQAALLADIDERIAMLRDLLAAKGLTDTTFTVAIIEEPTQLWLFTEMNFGAQLAMQADLALPDTVPTSEEAIAAGEGAYAVPVSLELLPLIDADHIFLFTNYNSDVEEALFANPVWQSFAAPNPKRIHFLNGEYWVRDHPISAHRIIDDLFRYIAGVEPSEVAPNPFAYTYQVEPINTEATD